MAEKLNGGDAFPKLELRLVGGRTIIFPDGIESRYKAILFYRGHW